jgi:FMN phosphatase YigB (HAD superfamily)
MHEPVILIDVDDTLFDNDRFATDLTTHLDESFGTTQRERYWAIYTALRSECGYADYLGALQKFRVGLDDDPALLRMSSFLLDYPFANGLYPLALDAVAHLRSLGLTVVLSDGDAVFQPHKILRAGIWDAVEGRVQVYVHKECMLGAVQRRYPAQHYLMVDDKPLLLAAMKRALGAQLTTIFVRQGHYAMEAANTVIDPAPDVTIEHIGDLIGFDRLPRGAAEAADFAAGLRNKSTKDRA